MDVNLSPKPPPLGRPLDVMLLLLWTSSSTVDVDVVDELRPVLLLLEDVSPGVSVGLAAERPESAGGGVIASFALDFAS